MAVRSERLRRCRSCSSFHGVAALSAVAPALPISSRASGSRLTSATSLCGKRECSAVPEITQAARERAEAERRKRAKLKRGVLSPDLDDLSAHVEKSDASLAGDGGGGER